MAERRPDIGKTVPQSRTPSVFTYPSGASKENGHPAPSSTRGRGQVQIKHGGAQDVGRFHFGAVSVSQTQHASRGVPVCSDRLICRMYSQEALSPDRLITR